MYQGIHVVENFEKWNEWWKEKRIPISELPPGDYYQNMGVVFKTPEGEPKAKEHGVVKGDCVVHLKRYFPASIKPVNTEQTIAMELLNDPSIPLVTMFGNAGSGKTLLACAHAVQSLKKEHVNKVVIAKSLTPVGRDVGYLKGYLEDKVFPWLGPFFDNFEKCGMPKFHIQKLIEEDKVEIAPITFIQGRSISNAIIVVDEVQNLSWDVLKQVVTRAAENCKIILLGDPSQRFEKGPPIDLTKFVEKGKISPLVGHVFFRKSIRSPLAEWAVENL